MTMKKNRLFPVVVCAAALIFPRGSFAQTMQERLISSAFKTLAKTYIAASDLEKLKRNTLAILEGLDTESFREKYPRTLQIVEESPVLAKQFGLRPDMSVAQARSFVRSLNKKKVSMLIDAVPDTVVARHVAEDISGKKQTAASKNIADQAAAVWRTLQDRLDRTAQRSRP